MDIFWRFRAARHISFAPKSIEIDIKKLHIKFLALNVNFYGPSLDFLGSRKPAHERIKERYPRKSRYFTVVGQSCVKTGADRHGHATYHKNTSDELNIDYEMAGDRLTVCEQELR